MTFPPLPRLEVPWWARAAAVAGPAALVGAWLFAGVGDSANDSLPGTLTGGSHAPGWWASPAAVMVAGLADIVVAAGLRPGATTGRWLLAIGGAIGVVAAGMSVLNRTGFLYQELTNVALVTLCVWPVALTPAQESGSPGRMRRLGDGLFVGLGVLSTWYVITRTGSATTRSSYGLPQRLLVLAQSVAPLIVVGSMTMPPVGRSHSGRAQTESRRPPEG